MIVLVAAFSLAGMATWWYFSFSGSGLALLERWAVALVPALLATVGLGAGWRLVQRGRRMTAAADAAAIDRGLPFVLYLRSFIDDETGTRAVPAFGLINEEEHLANALSAVGPLLAVGLPGEAMPPLGARRVQLDDSEWQVAVQQWMTQAKLVVLRIGDSPGFWWEVQQALQLVKPQRIVFVVPHGAARYERFGRRINQLSPNVFIPPYSSQATEGGVSIAAFLAFDEDTRMKWLAPSLPRNRLAQWFQPLSVPLACVLGQAVGERLRIRTAWISQISSIGFGALRVTFVLFMVGCLLGVQGIFLMIAWDAWDDSPHDRYLIPGLVGVTVVVIGGYAAGLSWSIRAALAAGPIWPGRRKPGERLMSYLCRLWRMQRMRWGSRGLHAELVSAAVNEAPAKRMEAVDPATLETLERAYHTATGALGADHPDLAPLLERLSAGHERLGNRYDAVMAQAGAVYLGRRFFGPGHPDYAKGRSRLEALLRRYPAVDSEAIAHLLGH